MKLDLANITEENIAKTLDIYFKENYRRINFLMQKEIMEELNIPSKYKYVKYMQIYTKYYGIPFYKFNQRGQPLCTT